MVRFNIIFLFIAYFLSLQAASAGPLCSAEFAEKTPLAKTYYPYSGFFNNVPPWKYARALLLEQPPVNIQAQLDKYYSEISEKLKGSYLEIFKQFKNSPKLFDSWIQGRSGFSIIDAESARERVVDYLQYDKLIFQWIMSEQKLSVEGLLQIHDVVMQSHHDDSEISRIRDVRIGKLRNTDVVGGNQKNLYPRYQEVPFAITQFTEWFEVASHHMHPIQLAAESYRWIVSIQPFQNGNKRVARWVADWVLIKNGYPPLLAPRQGFGFGGIVFGSLRYSENPRSWGLYSDFAEVVEHSVGRLNEDLSRLHVSIPE